MPNDLQLSDQDEVLLESLVLAASDNVARAPASDREQFAPARRRVFVETDGNENVYLGTGNAWVDVSENTGLLSSLFGGGDGNFDSVNTGSATVTNQVDAGSVNTDDAKFPVQGNNDVAGSRSPRTWYQNTTGYPIHVIVIIESEDSSNAHAIDSRANLNDTQSGQTISYIRQEENAGFLQRSSHNFHVPDQQYYKVDAFGDGSIVNWIESKIGVSN